MSASGMLLTAYIPNTPPQACRKHTASQADTFAHAEGGGCIMDWAAAGRSMSMQAADLKRHVHCTFDVQGLGLGRYTWL